MFEMKACNRLPMDRPASIRAIVRTDTRQICANCICVSPRPSRYSFTVSLKDFAMPGYWHLLAGHVKKRFYSMEYMRRSDRGPPLGPPRPPPGPIRGGPGIGGMGGLACGRARTPASETGALTEGCRRRFGLSSTEGPAGFGNVRKPWLEKHIRASSLAP